MYSPANVLRHIRDEARFLLDVVAPLSLETFRDDATVCRAAVRAFEVIGEASKKMSDADRLRYPDVDWRGLAGLRDVLIHHYIGVDYGLLYRFVQERVPDLAARIDEALGSEHNLAA